MKNIYKCKVNGLLRTIGKYGVMCAKSGVNGRCAAHGNYKCEHKIKEPLDLINVKYIPE